MAAPRTAAKTPGMTGGWFWLAASFAATLYGLHSRPVASEVVGELAAQAVAVGFAVVLWSLAGRILGAILRAATRAPAPGWIFRVNGWSVATLGAGVLMALQAGADPRVVHDPKTWFGTLFVVAWLGFGWWLVIDVGRALLDRLARRRPRPFFSVAGIAFICGLMAIAWVIYGHLEGFHNDPPPRVGIAALAAVLAAGVIGTLLIELPGALLARRRSAGPDEGAMDGARALIARRLRERATAPAPATTAAAPARLRASEEHGRHVTPPTVVRSR